MSIPVITHSSYPVFLEAKPVHAIETHVPGKGKVHALIGAEVGLNTRVFVEYVGKTMTGSGAGSKGKE